MKPSLFLCLFLFIAPLGSMYAQDAKQNFLKAQELYGAARYVEAERLLVEVERQLGGPKAATISLVILCQYKSNSFNSNDLLARVAELKAMNVEETDLYKEILQIERTVQTWKRELDARIASIVSSKDVDAARDESEKNYKIKDYNLLFDALHDEIYTLQVSPGKTASYKDWYNVIAGLRKIESGSKFGFQASAAERIAVLERDLIARVAADKYPDEAERLYKDLLVNGRYYGDVVKNTQDRRAAEARVAEERRVAEQQRNDAKKKELLENAAKYDKMASSQKFLGGLKIVGGAAGLGLGIYILSSILSSENVSDVGVFEYIGAGAGLGFGAGLLAGSERQFKAAKSLAAKAGAKRQEAQRYGTRIAPIFGVDRRGDLISGFTLKLEY